LASSNFAFGSVHADTKVCFSAARVERPVYDGEPG
jgi:hypothetical protein